MPLSIALCCAGCAEGPGFYRGTGLLQTNGVPSTELASHSITFTSCLARESMGAFADHHAERDRDASFAILAIGDQCVIDGVGVGGEFRPDAEGVCTLVFSDGARTLRVADVIIRHGVRTGPWDARLHVDASTIEVQVSGDDANSGQPALYRFSGRMVSDGGDQMRCAEERPRHERSARADPP